MLMKLVGFGVCLIVRYYVYICTQGYLPRCVVIHVARFESVGNDACRFMYCHIEIGLSQARGEILNAIISYEQLAASYPCD